MVKDTKIFCRKCKSETSQELLFKNDSIEPMQIFAVNEGDSVEVEKTAWVIGMHSIEVYKCLGCKKTNIEEYAITVPGQKIKKQIGIKAPEDWIFRFPQKYVKLYSEIITSYNNNSLILCSAGLRTIMDIYMVDKVGDLGSFKKKLDKLLEEKIISSSQYELLDTIVDFGSASIHRGFVPSLDNIKDVLEIVELILKQEILLKNSKILSESIPKRKKEDK